MKKIIIEETQTDDEVIIQYINDNRKLIKSEVIQCQENELQL